MSSTPARQLVQPFPAWSLAGGLDQSSHYAGSLDIRNNVVYNWLARTTDGGVDRLNYVNNYFKPGPSTTQTPRLFYRGECTVAPGSFYANQNVMEGSPELTKDNWKRVRVFDSYVEE